MNKKIKLSLNKTIVSRLQNNEQNSIFGGAAPTTWLDGCLEETEYPRCAVSGCDGGASCDTMINHNCIPYSDITTCYTYEKCKTVD